MPDAGELFVLWDGDGLVVKRVEPVHDAPGAQGGEREGGQAAGLGPPRLHLLSANPDYPAYVCRTDDVHIVGKVLWKITRA